MKASHLGKVIGYFDPMMSLDYEHQDWYVERPDSPQERIKLFLLNDPAASKVLFSGHGGSGKTSTLNRLVLDPQIQERFTVVKFSVKDDLNVLDVKYTDLLVALGRRLFEAGEKWITLDPKLLNDLNTRAAEVSTSHSRGLGLADLRRFLRGEFLRLYQTEL